MPNSGTIWLASLANRAVFLAVLMPFGMRSHSLSLLGTPANSTNAAIQPTLLMFGISYLSPLSHSSK